MSDETLLSVRGIPQYTGVSTHTSAYNVPICLFWGRRRITPNVLWWSTISNAVVSSELVFTQANTIGPIFGTISFPSGSGFQSVIDGERATVPSSGPFQYTANHPHYSSNISVSYYGTSITLTDVSPSSPTAAGQYSVNLLTGLYTFDSADANALVVISYTWTQSAAVTIPTTGKAWFVPAIFSLGEGPIDAVLQAWDGTSPVGTYRTLSAQSSIAPYQGYTFFPGSSSQNVWGEWANRNAAHPINSFLEESLIPYRFTAYLAAWAVESGTGDNPELPQQSVECVRHNGGSSYASPPGDYNLAWVIPDLLTNPQYGMGLSSADIDNTTLGQFFDYCTDQGLFFSPLLTGQDKAIDIMDRFARLNSWIVADGPAIIFAPIGGAS